MASKKNDTPAPAANDTGINMEALAALRAATDSEAGFLYMPEEVAAPMVAAGFAEINYEMRNADGFVAARALKESIMDQNKNTPAPVSAFVLEENIPVPTSRAPRARGESKYPFDAMNVGHSFFIPATEDVQDPAKTYASLVSSANQRFAVPTGETRASKKKNGETVMVEKKRFTKRFLIRPVEENGVKGARVWRAADFVVVRGRVSLERK